MCVYYNILCPEPLLARDYIWFKWQKQYLKG